jgi:hypothetical protein
MNENRRCSIRFRLLVPGQFAFPQAVAAAAVGGDQQATGLRIAGAAHALPPAADRIDGEAGGIVVDADTHPSRGPATALLANPVTQALQDRSQVA